MICEVKIKVYFTIYAWLSKHTCVLRHVEYINIGKILKSSSVSFQRISEQDEQPTHPPIYDFRGS
jgi:hypothetical protein